MDTEIINLIRGTFSYMFHSASFITSTLQILGTKGGSTLCGTPGLSKKKAFENRVRTLAVEWKERGKRNEV